MKRNFIANACHDAQNWLTVSGHIYHAYSSRDYKKNTVGNFESKNHKVKDIFNINF